MSQPTIINNLLLWLSKRGKKEQRNLILEFFDNPDHLSTEETIQMEGIVNELKFRLTTSNKDQILEEILGSGIDKKNAVQLVEKSGTAAILHPNDIKILSTMPKKNFEWIIPTTIEFFMTRKLAEPPSDVKPSLAEEMASFRVLFRMVDTLISIAVDDQVFRKIFSAESMPEERIELICLKVKQSLTPIRHVLSFHMLQGVSASNSSINLKLDELLKTVRKMSSDMTRSTKKRK